MTRQSPHFHKYELRKWPNQKSFYKCVLPGCSHYLPIARLAEGRESLCHGFECNNLVTLTHEDVVREIKKPMCSVCKERRKEKKEELSRIS
jgi:hypothetical protein